MIRDWWVDWVSHKETEAYGKDIGDIILEMRELRLFKGLEYGET